MLKLEILISLLIVSIIRTGLYNNYASFIAKHEIKACAAQLEHTLALAQSIALSQQQSVKICPSQDKRNCNLSWQGYLLIIAPGLTPIIRKLPCPSCGMTLAQSTFNQHYLLIHADGFSQSNGHFSINSRAKQQNFGSSRLYFNRGLRFYWR